jgi:hypothetical protein
LKRESIRLSQLQDIAGCRVVVPSAVRQEQVLSRLTNRFPGSRIVDRRVQPSHGYRAIHLIVAVDGMLVEVQLRTALQHAWAELSEKTADMLDPAIKYGGGPEAFRNALLDLSQVLERVERFELETSRRRREVARGARGLEAARHELKVQQARLRALAKRFPAARDTILQNERKLSALRIKAAKGIAKANAFARKAASSRAQTARLRRSAMAMIESNMSIVAKLVAKAKHLP